MITLKAIEAKNPPIAKTPTLALFFTFPDAKNSKRNAKTRGKISKNMILPENIPIIVPITAPLIPAFEPPAHFTVIIEPNQSPIMAINVKIPNII